MSERSDSVETLRKKSEHRRAELKQTLNELSGMLSDTTEEIKTTLSPQHLKQEARAYAKEKRAAAVASIKEHVESNPLQALAIGAAVTYPLLGIARRVPVPLALIGAGLLLSRNGAAAKNAGPARVKEDMSGESLDSADGTSTNGAAADMPGMEEIMPGNAASGSSTSRGTRSDGIRAIMPDGNSVMSMIERNPLLVGGLAVAVGGFIAASLPASRTEEQVVGKARGVVKAKTRKAAAEAIRGAKARAAEIADDVAAAAEREGLTPEALGEVVAETSEKVASVVRRAVDEAVGPEPAAGTTETSNDNDGGPYARR